MGYFMLERLYWNYRLRKWHSKKLEKLKASDVVILRYPKSGVTWLRVMISFIYQHRSASPFSHLIGSKEFAEHVSDAPKLLIANANMGLSNDRIRRMLKGRKIILLLRDPRDIAVSLYFHFSKRATKLEHLSYGIPEGISALGLYEFMMNPQYGLVNIMNYLNFWTASLERDENAIVIRYEDLRLAPHEGLRRVMNVLSRATTDAEIKAAVDFAAFERMREREAQRATTVAILSAADETDTESFKVRRGKVGGYVDYLTPEERMNVDSLVATHLNPSLGY